MSDVPALHRAIMGTEYERLDAAVQRFHRLRGSVALEGFAEVSGPSNFAGRLVALLIGTPTHSTQAPIRFELDAEPECETWTRIFAGRTMRSTLNAERGLLCERLGAAVLEFEIRTRDGRLEQTLVALRCFGTAVPRFFWPRIVALESGAGTRFHFHVEAHLPIIGRVVKYVGHLDLPPEQPIP